MACELLGAFVPGAGALSQEAKSASAKSVSRTQHLSDSSTAQVAKSLLLSYEQRPAKEIGNELLLYLAEDFRESLSPHLNRAVSAVLLFDTFEAVSAGLQNEEHQRLRERWIRDAAANFDFALTVIAGQTDLLGKKPTRTGQITSNNI